MVGGPTEQRATGGGAPAPYAGGGSPSPGPPVHTPGSVGNRHLHRDGVSWAPCTCPHRLQAPPWGHPTASPCPKGTGGATEATVPPISLTEDQDPRPHDNTLSGWGWRFWWGWGAGDTGVCCGDHLRWQVGLGQGPEDRQCPSESLVTRSHHKALTQPQAPRTPALGPTSWKQTPQARPPRWRSLEQAQLPGVGGGGPGRAGRTPRSHWDQKHAGTQR